MGATHLSHLVSSMIHNIAMKSRSLRFLIESSVFLAVLVCCLMLDRRRLLGSPAADLLGIYTGDGLVRTDVYERDIVGIGLDVCAVDLVFADVEN